MSVVFVGIPTKSGDLRGGTFDSLFAEVYALRERGVYLLPRVRPGDFPVWLARNIIVEEFLATPEAEQIVFIDDDVSWDVGALMRLLEIDEPLVGGAYPFKQDELTHEFPVRWLPSREPDARGLVEVEGLPGGFMNVHREVFERMAEAGMAPEMTLRPPDKVRGWFEQTVHQGLLVGEDYFFCMKWRALGGRVWLDPRPKMKHHGRKDWSGCVADVLAIEKEAQVA